MAISLVFSIIVWLYRNLNIEVWKTAPRGSVMIAPYARVCVPCVWCSTAREIDIKIRMANAFVHEKCTRILQQACPRPYLAIIAVSLVPGWIPWWGVCVSLGLCSLLGSPQLALAPWVLPFPLRTFSSAWHLCIGRHTGWKAVLNGKQPAEDIFFLGLCPINIPPPPTHSPHDDHYITNHESGEGRLKKSMFWKDKVKQR